MRKQIPIRHTDKEQYQVGDYYDKLNRYYDNVSEHTVVKLFTGDCYVTGDPREMLVTILGSCVAVCARDPVAKVGGMNHILLPGTGKIDLHHTPETATRYGAFAMEELINGILKKGGRKDRLEIKLFGGAQVMETATMIGERNVAFVEEYLHNENLKVISEDVGGNLPRRIHYFPDTGKVKMRRLQRKDDLVIAQEEKKYATRTLPKASQSGDVELF